MRMSWLIARRFSPFDAVFLPANGAVVEIADPENEFRAHSGRRAHVLAVGEWLDLRA